MSELERREIGRQYELGVEIGDECGTNSVFLSVALVARNAILSNRTFRLDLQVPVRNLSSDVISRGIASV